MCPLAATVWVQGRLLELPLGDGHLLFRWRITQGGEDRMSTRRPCCPLTWTGRTAPQSRNYRPQSHTCGWWSTGLQAWRSLFGSGVSRSRAGRAQPPHAIAARSCGAGTSSGGSTLGGWTSTKRCGDQGRGPLFRLKGSALRHSVERLVLDTVFVTFGMQWTGLSSTLHSANDPSIGHQYRRACPWHSM